jgi:outer membrane protein OmpA-like peptidoglycan-associated protein
LVKKARHAKRAQFEIRNPKFKMRPTILSFLLPFFQNCFSQELLLNNSFEDENICTEYNVNCAPEAWISSTSGFANYFKEEKRAYSGTHCMGIVAGAEGKFYRRSYIRSQMVCRLRKGGAYRVTFFLKSPHAILDSIGIYFTNYDFFFEKNVWYRIIPSEYVADGITKPTRKDSSWQKVVIEYVADGTENFITIGNFSKKDINGITGLNMENQFFVYIDDVSLVPVNPDEKICEDWQRNKDDIYAFNARHQYLDHYIKAYQKNPPDPPSMRTPTLPIIDTLIFPDILFQTARSELVKDSYPFLDSLVFSVEKKQIDSVVVEGHTDNTGTAVFNRRLSVDRATTVADYLRKKMPGQTVVSRGLASEHPVAGNNSPEGRQRNRRVEILIYTRE